MRHFTNAMWNPEKTVLLPPPSDSSTQNNTEMQGARSESQVCTQRVLATLCYIKKHPPAGATKKVTLLFAEGVKKASKHRGSLNLLPLTSTGQHVTGNWCTFECNVSSPVLWFEHPYPLVNAGRWWKCDSTNAYKKVGKNEKENPHKPPHKNKKKLILKKLAGFLLT